ncbi:Type IV fimbrial biogenesis protein PilY1 [Olavius sp. associated proteobacterium Delta 1]|nr:Type IV fimbrial biogenesis protein PilY1 [Olavius sp. associated proteobacterium Delta 1]
MKKLGLIIMVLILSTPAMLPADDTEIYGTVTSTSLEPNVLIIFDSSGSMVEEDVPGEPYNPLASYSGDYTEQSVYIRVRIRRGVYEWQLFAALLSDLNCTPIFNELFIQGYARGRIKGASQNYTCASGGTRKTLRLGNYLNYVDSGVGEDRRRIDVAKEVIRDLIDKTDGVRFGAMRFNYQDGGQLIAECGIDKASLKSQISAIEPDGWTPLAETLAEAGLYFAGQDSWFNPGVTYTSPIQERCQKNYIIIMTDGEPTEDIDSKLTSTNYINGDKIGDYDNDGDDPGTYALNGSDYLDDVAKYLYENDCHTTLGDGTSFDKQNIEIFTIGFQLNHSLLEDTALNGGGEYFTATNYSELSEAFYHIMSSISEENAVFVAPVVPISRMNRTYAGDRIYLGFFKPQLSGRWIGNIKRYGLDSHGNLYDANDVLATTPDGLIKSNALSYWTTMGNDGPDVSAGGAAEVLQLLIDGASVRNVYTYTGSQDLLTNSTNAFADSNASLTNSLLGVASDTARQDLIATVRGSAFGDIIHSEPVVVYYPDPDGDVATDDDKTMIYTGSNDGMLHCIDDDDGSEAWSFIPPSQLDRLSLLTNADHDYFVDGSPVIYQNDYQNADPNDDLKILIFGERRGGHDYTALDISSPTAPEWLYSFGPHILDTDLSDGSNPYEILGQSWGKPEIATIATGSVATIADCDLSIETTVAAVFLIPGGYDNNQDLETPSLTDTVGRALFAINVASGAPVDNFNFDAVDNSTLGMTHSFVDMTALDHDGDGIHSRVYAGDLGGNIFAFKDDEEQTYELPDCSTATDITQVTVDGVWSAKKLFVASDWAGGVQRKIFYSPDAVSENNGEMIFFGTGDRSDPGETDVVNRIYAVKNDWASSSTLTESNLVDVTDDLIQLGTEAEIDSVKVALTTANGWFIRLQNPGEKVVASPRVHGGVVYFTTYTPSDGTEPAEGDPCSVSTVRGVGRLYAVDYKTGASVLELSDVVETGNSGNVVELGKNDRSVAIGTAIPSAPVIAVLSGGARIFIGVEGGIASLPTVSTYDMYTYFWNQIF